MSDRGQVTVHARDWFEGQKQRYERVPQAVVRELVQNACDAILRAELDGDPRIDIRIDGPRVTVCDPGIGFDAASLQHLAVVRASGTRPVKEQQRPQRRDGFGVEGQFGVGFYATAMCAERVVVRTRSRRVDEAWQWTFHPADFSFEREPLPQNSRPFGTEVEVLVARQWQRLFLDPHALTQLLREVCDFVPFPIHLDGAPRPTNTMQPPWDRADASPAACEAYLRERALLHADDELLFATYLPWRPDVGLSGLLYVPKWSSLAPAIDLHVNRYAVARATDLLPDALPFLHGVVIATDVDVNEARERVTHNERSERLRQQLCAWALCGDPTWTPGADSNAHHRPMAASAAPCVTPPPPPTTSCSPTRAPCCAPPPAAAPRAARSAVTCRCRCCSAATAPCASCTSSRPTDRWCSCAAPTRWPAPPRWRASSGCRWSTAPPRRSSRSCARGQRRVEHRALREDRGEGSSAVDDAAAWQDALQRLAAIERHVATADCAPLGPGAALQLDFAALRHLPEFRFLDQHGGDWQDVLRFLSVPETAIADGSRRTWLQLMESVWKARWPVLLNTDHPLAQALRRRADRAADGGAALAEVLVYRALRELGVAWSAELSRKLQRELDSALTRLLDPPDPST